MRNQELPFATHLSKSDEDDIRKLREINESNSL